MKINWQFRLWSNNRVMDKTFLSMALAALVFSGLGEASVRATPTEQLAGELIFYLAAEDQLLHRDQLDRLLSRRGLSAGGSASALVYGRLLDEWKAHRASSKFMSKSLKKPSNIFHFKAHQVREAALLELMALGKEAQRVLLESVRSARQEVSMGVVRALRTLDVELVLPVLIDVMERDQWGQSPFSDRVRREAMISLSQIKTDDERWDKLLSEALVDLDFEIRQMAREIAVGRFVDDADRSEAWLQLGWAHELKLYEADRRFAGDIGLREVFDERGEKSFPLLRALESMLRVGLWPAVSIPEALLSNYDVLRLLLKYMPVLPPQQREEVLKISLGGGIGVLQFEALRLLENDDKASFSSQVLSLVSHQQAPHVLLEAMSRCQLWGLEISGDILMSLKTSSRHEKIRAKAEELLASL